MCPYAVVFNFHRLCARRSVWLNAIQQTHHLILWSWHWKFPTAAHYWPACALHRFPWFVGQVWTGILDTSRTSLPVSGDSLPLCVHCEFHTSLLLCFSPMRLSPQSPHSETMLCHLSWCCLRRSWLGVCDGGWWGRVKGKVGKLSLLIVCWPYRTFSSVSRDHKGS